MRGLDHDHLCEHNTLSFLQQNCIRPKTYIMKLALNTGEQRESKEALASSTAKVTYFMGMGFTLAPKASPQTLGTTPCWLTQTGAGHGKAI